MAPLNPNVDAWGNLKRDANVPEHVRALQPGGGNLQRFNQPQQTNNQPQQTNYGGGGGMPYVPGISNIANMAGMAGFMPMLNAGLNYGQMLAQPIQQGWDLAQIAAMQTAPARRSAEASMLESQQRTQRNQDQLQSNQSLFDYLAALQQGGRNASGSFNVDGKPRVAWGEQGSQAAPTNTAQFNRRYV